jgi:hypothetical protein
MAHNARRNDDAQQPRVASGHDMRMRFTDVPQRMRMRGRGVDASSSTPPQVRSIQPALPLATDSAHPPLAIAPLTAMTWLAYCSMSTLCLPRHCPYPDDPSFPTNRCAYASREHSRCHRLEHQLRCTMTHDHQPTQMTTVRRGCQRRVADKTQLSLTPSSTRSSTRSPRTPRPCGGARALDGQRTDARALDGQRTDARLHYRLRVRRILHSQCSSS